MISTTSSMTHSLTPLLWTQGDFHNSSVLLTASARVRYLNPPLTAAAFFAGRRVVCKTPNGGARRCPWQLCDDDDDDDEDYEDDEDDDDGEDGDGGDDDDDDDDDESVDGGGGDGDHDETAVMTIIDDLV